MFYDLFYNLKVDEGLIFIKKVSVFRQSAGFLILSYIILLLWSLNISILYGLVDTGLITTQDETAKENRKLLKYEILKLKIRLLTSLEF